FQKLDVPIIDISFATKPGDVNPMDYRFLFQAFQSLLQVQITAPQKIAVYLGRGSRSKRSNRPFRTLPLDFLFRYLISRHPTREKRLGKSSDVLPSLMAHTHHISAHLLQEERRRDIA